MSKYDSLWEFIKNDGGQTVKLSFEETEKVTGIPIDHSFLNYKKELTSYGYTVGKISLKEKYIVFNKTEKQGEVNMELKRVTAENIDKEHICCAISNEKDCQVVSKKGWLRDRFNDGLVFLKGDVRGKCFIEYIPAENAWAPVAAPNYMYIDCFWVSGQFKGQGNSNLLLEECIKDSKERGKSGLVILSSDKKKPFLADPKYLAYKGFKKIDSAEPFFTLMYLPFDENADVPKFKASVSESKKDNSGIVIYYADQCPFTAKYVPILENMAKEADIKLKTVHITTKDEAQNAPSPYTSFSLFYNGVFVTNEIPSEKKFIKLVEQLTK